ncbi:MULTISPECIES: TolC family protein [unclassified Siphonobacter]|uniref:TolC family protein n=1 Tax=unclassified Siphonobacter TaxID=2635712 RepID=UPI00277D52CF|nr:MULTISPECIES: TolC family protein [unclassified Siphonobacter]MDQ1085851.1 outer membrane protein [Siphonobacter sp. SORGH_AS_1065]MDR6196122.1 outer membrane protein [Siphonobacter sp. SORGH_AS_0500]
MKKLILGGFLLLSGMLQAQTPMTLKEAVSIAIRNNLNVRQNELTVETSRNNLLQSKLALLPSAQANASQSLNYGRSIDPYTNGYVNQQLNASNFSLSASLILYNGLYYRNMIRQNDLLVKATEQDVQQAKDVITINTILAYLQVLSSEDQVNLATQQLEASKMQLERTAELVKAGNLAPSDEYTLGSQVANDQLSLVNAQGQLKLNRLTFWQTLNSPQTPLDFTLERLAPEGEMGYETSATKIYESADQNLAVIKAAKYRVLSMEQLVRAQKGLLTPQLSLNSFISTRYSSTASINYADQLGNNFNRNFSLDLSIPIFRSWLYKNRIQNAIVDKKKAEVQVYNAQVQVKQGIEQAYANLEVAKMRYEALENQVVSFTETLNAAESRFQAGTLNVVEYNIAKTNLDRAKLNQVQARYDYLFRVKILDYYQGKNLFVD